MPPIRKYDREKIIEVALNIVERSGLENLTARALARELGCTVNPIFHNFSSMDELTKELYDRIYEIYKIAMLEGSKKEKSYKGMGLAYISFAKNHPEFFKMLFMQTTNLEPKDFVIADKIGDEVIKSGQKLTGFSFEEQKAFHVKVWIFTHGIACLVATKTVKMTDAEIDKLLESTVREMVRGYKERNK